jgi:hypothetical protein
MVVSAAGMLRGLDLTRTPRLRRSTVFEQARGVSLNKASEAGGARIAVTSASPRAQDDRLAAGLTANGYYTATAPPGPVFPRLSGLAEADVAVLGAGFAGWCGGRGHGR